MATLSISIPNAQVQRVTRAFGRRLNLRTADLSAERDATTEEVRQEVIAFIRAAVKQYEQGLAIELAAAAVADISPA